MCLADGAGRRFPARSFFLASFSCAFFESNVWPALLDQVPSFFARPGRSRLGRVVRVRRLVFPLPFSLSASARLSFVRHVWFSFILLSCDPFESFLCARKHKK